MLPRVLAFALLLCTAAFARAADVEFVRVWPAYREADSFDRIREYFGGSEAAGREVVLRTQPVERAGYYFLVRVKRSTAPAGTRFELSVIHPGTPEPKTYTFPADLPRSEVVFQLGLTGADWAAGPKGNPVAWKLALVDGQGRVLADQKSFLWEKPAK